MKRDLFLAIAVRIMQRVSTVKFVDLWNEHLADITQTTAFPVPSVFVEFEPYEIHKMANHVVSADVPIRLHIITRAKNYTGGVVDTRINEALDHLTLVDDIHAALATLAGDRFSTLMPTQSITNHNHTELIESIECYTTHIVSTAAMRPMVKPSDLPPAEPSEPEPTEEPTPSEEPESPSEQQ